MMTSLFHGVVVVVVVIIIVIVVVIVVVVGNVVVFRDMRIEHESIQNKKCGEIMYG